MKNYEDIGKYISIIQRVKNAYFARELESYPIGCGQQFFLLQISAHPGITLQELATYGCYDKATATRAVQKLEEEAYVCTEIDTHDKRVRHIYITSRAEPVIQETKDIIQRWTAIVLKGLSEEEQCQAESVLKKMASNAYTYLKEQ